MFNQVLSLVLAMGMTFPVTPLINCPSSDAEVPCLPPASNRLKRSVFQFYKSFTIRYDKKLLTDFFKVLIMDRTKWLIHPVFILVISILALVTSLFLYIYWYIEISSGFKTIIERFNLDTGQFLTPHTWFVIMVLTVLVGVIIMGIFIIFVYNLKTLRLYQLQHNFINNFTHELKTPVTSLKLYLETFLKHELSREDQLKYTQYMLTDTGRLSEDINRILNLAQIESKSDTGEFVFRDLPEIIENFYQNNSHLFRNCDIRVHLPEKESFSYRIIPPLFEMLLMNLFTNAINYNNEAVQRIDITFEKQRKKLIIRFKDNGIGIDNSELKKIFKKFYQVGRSDDMSAKGSGLGLYLVDHIAKIHKGKIKAESAGTGKGSVFSLILPLRN
jgi:two-component system phosphate regulon sensor histidine kinase PhoR